MRRQLRCSKRRLMHLPGWRVRLVFWGGALVVGSVSALFVLVSESFGRLPHKRTDDRDYILRDSVLAPKIVLSIMASRTLGLIGAKRIYALMTEAFGLQCHPAPDRPRPG